ncbi:MAG: hypothetical protein QG657_3333 [Acidobacteriota bacterium]|nr:hypothetical protein [Acidobacteriota bacterium]
MKKREIILVIAVIAFGVIYNSVKSGDIRFYSGCSPYSRELLDKKYPVEFPQKELQYTVKETDAAPSRRININNPAGDIEVGKSIDNTIRITPVIRVYHKDKEKAGDISRDIKLITRENGEEITITVESNERFPYNRARLGFKCLVPAKVELELKNRYGNIDINDTGQDINIDARYGDVFVKNVESPLKVKSYRGLVRLYDIKDSIQLDSNHSRVKIRNTTSLKLKCTHSNLVIEDVKEGIEITRSGYSELEIENAGRLNIDAQHTRMKLEKITGGVVLANTYEPISMTDIQGDINIDARQCRINVTNAVGDFLIVNNSYSNVVIDGFSGKTLDARLKNAELDVTFENIREKININTNSADVTLKYPETLGPAFDINSVNGKIFNSTPAQLTVQEEREKRWLKTLEGKPQITIDAKYADVFLKNITTVSTEAEKTGNLPAEKE